MTFPRHLLLAVLPLLVGAGLRAAPAPAPRVLRAGVETYSEPFTYRDDKGRPAGFSVELLQAAAQAQGLEVEYQLHDWAELLEEFKQGRIDVICNIADTPEREEHMSFSTTTILMHGGLFVHRGTPPIQTAAGLAGKRLVVPRDSRAYLYAQHQNWHAQFVFAANIRECLLALNDGRADVMLSTRLVTEHMIKAGGYGNIVATDLQFPDFDYREHFAVQKDDHELLARLNEGLLTVHQSGAYDRLYEQWIGTLEPQQLHWRDVQPFLPLATLVAMATLGIIVWQRRLLNRLSRQAQEIRANEERLQLVFEGSQDGFWDWEVDSGKVLRSPRWTGMLGYAPGEIDGDRASFHKLVHPDERGMVMSEEELIWTGKRDHFSREFRMQARSGEWKWILDRGKVVARDPATGLPRRVTGTHTDITARKLAAEEADKLQHKMLETQKLESLGVLAGGIAHDFNNLLTVILGNSTLARMEAAESPGNRARLDSVVTAAHRAAALCHQLLAYAGKGSYVLARINLNDIVAETTRLLELSISKQARLEFTLAPALPRIEADPSQIQQVIMNLVINASEALTQNPGVIRISTAVVSLPLADEIGPTAEVAPGDYVCVQIADTGCGMTPEVLARIFDPFFTTKFTGRGLGLAAVTGIVRTHHGTLRVQSTPGAGSRFSVYLPVSQAQTAHPFASVSPAPRP